MSGGKPGNPGWPKGVSGNPGGRRKADYRIKDLTKKYTPECIARLRQIMNQDDDLRSAVAAAMGLLAYAWGKPSQSVDLTNSDGSLASAWAAARHGMEAEEQAEAGVTH
jgi:hypothetical protein